jgi:hypothetical protein
MVTFPMTMGGHEVRVNGHHFGWLSKKNGFFTDSTVVSEYLEVSPKDLREIAEKAERIKATGSIHKPEPAKKE